MARFLKANKEHIGLSPYSLQLRGNQKKENVDIQLIDYNLETVNERKSVQLIDLAQFDNEGTTSWLNVTGVHDGETMEAIIAAFQLDPIIASNIMTTNARPTIFEYDNCIYISFKMLQINEETNEAFSENIVIVIKENVLISFQEVDGDVFDPIRDRIRKSKKKIRVSGTDYLAFCLLDIVFDHYALLISRIGDYIESVEEALLKHANKKNLNLINDYKQEIIYLKKSIKPCREVILAFGKMDSDIIEYTTDVHIKELEDNLSMSIESLESYREMLSDLLNIYHMSVTSNLNDIMRFLTIFSVIFIPLTFIAGIYGTNFDNIPELHMKNGYYIMWGVMIVISVGMIYYFKKKKWF